MRIGLFGGTFDPIHWGHLRSAEEVGETFGLDRIFFIPEAIAPHSSLQGVSYSIDTIREFAAKKRRGDALFFIIGLDAFREIGSWKDYAELFPLCNFIVTSRPGSKERDPLRGTGVAVKKLFCYDLKRKNYRHRSGTHIYFIELTDIAISASEVRELVRKRQSIRYLVPSSLEKYIKRRGLYRGPRGSGSR